LRHAAPKERRDAGLPVAPRRLLAQLAKQARGLLAFLAVGVASPDGEKEVGGPLSVAAREPPADELEPKARIEVESPLGDPPFEEPGFESLGRAYQGEKLDLAGLAAERAAGVQDRKSTRLDSSHVKNSYD